jgi:ubiquinone/menaquinone biosynthesis C-methylase UbiE
MSFRAGAVWRIMIRELYMRNRRILTSLGLCAFVASFPHMATAQLASRPAADWSKTLESHDRVASLKMDEIVAKLRLKPGESVADIGAGSGLFEVPLAKAVSPGGKVYAVDIDEGFFPQIKRKADEAHVNNVETVLGKLTYPNLPSRNVDMVFLHDVLHHIQDRAGYLKSVAGYLKPGGRVVVIDYEAGQGPHKAQPDLQVSREQLGAWAKAAGLKQAEDLKMFPDRYFLVYSK